MNKARLKRLEKKGWKATTAAEFLGLTPEEEAYIEFRLALADGIKARRDTLGLTQEQLATMIGSGQSRVAKIEAADLTVSVDLLLQTFLKLGGSVQVQKPTSIKNKSSAARKKRVGAGKKGKAGRFGRRTTPPQGRLGI